MGTRSLTHVKDETGATLVTIYRQCDGYPTGQGDDIKAALGGREMVNGYNDAMTQVNGIGDAAAILITAMKLDTAAAGNSTGPIAAGGVYIQTPGETDAGQDYTYTLFPAESTGEGWNKKPGALQLTVESYGETLYSGPLAEFDGATVEAQGDGD